MKEKLIGALIITAILTFSLFLGLPWQHPGNPGAFIHQLLLKTGVI